MAHYNAAVYCAILALSTKGQPAGIPRAVPARELYAALPIAQRSAQICIRRLVVYKFVAHELIKGEWFYTIVPGSHCPIDKRGRPKSDGRLASR